MKVKSYLSTNWTEKDKIRSSSAVNKLYHIRDDYKNKALKFGENIIDGALNWIDNISGAIGLNTVLGMGSPEYATVNADSTPAEWEYKAHWKKVFGRN